MKVIGHRISIQTLLFQTCLPTRQNGIENRDKAYSNELFFIQKYPGFLSRCRIKSLQGGVGGGGGEGWTFHWCSCFGGCLAWHIFGMEYIHNAPWHEATIQTLCYCHAKLNS